MFLGYEVVALGPGDIVFVGWDADNEDIGFVATAPVAAGEVIFFTDDEWNGTSFNSNEQLIRWTVPEGGLQPGDLVTIDMVPAGGNSTATIDRGGDVDYLRGGGQLAVSNEAFWAVQGEVVGRELVPNPDGFISVIANEADGNNNQTPNLANTGLTTATGAVIIDGDEDYMEFNLDADEYETQAELLAAVGDPGNWRTADGTGNSNPNGTGFTLDFTNVYCFTPGTAILTPCGERPVEQICAGDLVMTKEHGAVPVRSVMSRTLTLKQLRGAPNLWPVTIAPGALQANTPDRTLSVSPQHRMICAGAAPFLLFGCFEVLAPAVGMLPLDGIHQELPSQDVQYIHLAFDDHQIVFANGAETESLLPGSGTSEDPADTEAAFSCSADVPATSGPPPARRILKTYEALALAHLMGQHPEKPESRSIAHEMAWQER